VAFSRPTLRTLIDRVEGDIKNALGLNVILRRSTEKAFAKAIAGVAHSLHGHMRFISRQIFPDQADQEFLERWASIYGLDRNSATFAQFTVSGTGTHGSTIPAGTTIERSDGETYTTDALATVSAGVFSVSLTAVNAGANPSVEISDTLDFISPISGVDGVVSVDSIEVEGEDTESDESFRERLLDRIQNPPSGGTANDYIQFARTVAGVTRAWVLPGHLGVGTVGLTFVEDGEADIIPAPGKVAEVQAVIDVKKPVTADATVFAPVETQVDFDISLSPNTVSVQAAVEAEIRDLFLRESQVRGAYKEVGSTYSGIIPVSKIREAISVAAGEDDNVLNQPNSDVIPSDTGIVTVGNFIFSELI
jgi:uncharacterized phage protein gp47/JayE